MGCVHAQGSAARAAAARRAIAHAPPHAHRTAPGAAEAAAAPPDDRSRFLLDLEFVQCLANPHYINCERGEGGGGGGGREGGRAARRGPTLDPPSPSPRPGLAQNRFLDDPAFLAYLDHLAYWRRPEYARFLLYPHALASLDLLSSPAFRRVAARPATADALHAQQLWHWQAWRGARARERAEAEEGGGAGAAVGAG